MKLFNRLTKTIIVFIVGCIWISVVTAILLRLNALYSVKAYLYKLLIFDIFALILACIIAFFINREKKSVLGIDLITSILSLIIASLFMALFFSLGPMVIDRSYTIYSLAYMTDYDEPYTYEEIRNQFVIGYVDAGATQKRIDEQVSIGNLEPINNEYRITQKGKSLINIFRLVEMIFPVPDQSSIYPKKLN